MRQRIIDHLSRTLEGRDEILAFWQGGSAAFGRSDEMSDMDLQLLVKEGFVDGVRDLLEGTLRGVARIEASYVLPQPTWHGYWQGFYRLEGFGPYQLVDAVIMKESDRNLLTEPEIHGQAIVHFDRTGRGPRSSCSTASWTRSWPGAGSWML